MSAFFVLNNFTTNQSLKRDGSYQLDMIFYVGCSESNGIEAIQCRKQLLSIALACIVSSSSSRSSYQ